MSKRKKKYNYRRDGRVTHDEWWVVTTYGGDWMFECACPSEEDAKKILKEYKDLDSVVDCGIRKFKVNNKEGKWPESKTVRSADTQQE